jgi:hypothetical protein
VLSREERLQQREREDRERVQRALREAGFDPRTFENGDRTPIAGILRVALRELARILLIPASLVVVSAFIAAVLVPVGWLALLSSGRLAFPRVRGLVKETSDVLSLEWVIAPILAFALFYIGGVALAAAALGSGRPALAQLGGALAVAILLPALNVWLREGLSSRRLW